MGRAVELLVAVRGDEHDVFEMRPADVGPVGQHDARLEADHHVLGEREVDGLVHERLAMEAEAELVPGIAAVEGLARSRPRR